MSAPNPAEAYERLYVPAFFTPLGNALLDRVKPTKSDRVLDGNGLKFPVRANIATATAGGTAS